MTQITFQGTIATTCLAGSDITTGNVQVLPSWAPPIAYIDTTTPWLAEMIVPTTTAGKDVIFRQVKVRAYGSKSVLHSGAECIAIDTNVETGQLPLITLTYVAVGELVRP